MFGGLYNTLFGVTQAAFFVLPVLGKHPEEYPRFRDCFLHDDEHPEHDGRIQLYTRVGGGNRDDYQAEIDALRAMPGYVTDYDDTTNDSTYATFVFEIPEKWKADVAKALAGRLGETSQEYEDLIVGTFPKIEGKLREMFREARAEPESGDDAAQARKEAHEEG